MEYSKYIVPIYAGSLLIGTGVLYNSLLITAAHVVESLRRGGCLAFHYCQNRYTLQWDDMFFFEYNREKMGIFRDLAIFKTSITIKGISFESVIKHDGETASIYGYYDFNDGNLLINQDCGKIRLEPYWDENLKINIPMNKNSFLLMDISAIYECNSGCPLFVNDKVIGILSSGNLDYNYCRFVSSNHIIEILSM